MTQFAEFFLNHWSLFLVLLALSAMLAWNMLGTIVQGIANIAPATATQLLNHEDALVLDVREDAELAQGRILDALHVPLGRLEAEIGKLDKYRDRHVIVCCRVGNRSRQACSLLRRNGFEKVYNLQGGVQAWQNADLPLLKK